ncbi:MAG: hypothetical protein MJB14_20660, partial [Spirochaetes bacterium]|nr:hypothetical protein [Spirochaetota bacterium]
MKTKLFLIQIVQLLLTPLLFSDLIIEFSHLKNYYQLSPVEKKVYPIDSFLALKEVDEELIHRVILTSIEKSRLKALKFVGDNYQFNNIEIQLIHSDTFTIADLVNYYYITFSIGEYDSVVLHTALNFGEKPFNRIDMIATSYAVKELLSRLTGKLEVKSDLPLILSPDQYNNILFQIQNEDPLPVMNTVLFTEILKTLDEEKQQLLKDSYLKYQGNPFYYFKAGLSSEQIYAVKAIFNNYNSNFIQRMFYSRNNLYRLKAYLKSYDKDYLRSLLDRQRFNYYQSMDKSEKHQLLKNFITLLKNQNKMEQLTNLQKYI